MLRLLLAALLALTLAGCARRDERSLFETWLAAAPARAEAFSRFEDLLIRERVSGVVSNDQLWVVDQLKPECSAEPYATPPEALWLNIVATLRFVRDHVKPAIGEVEVLSGHRAEEFNDCIGGAPESAHRAYHALDLVPVDPATGRDQLIERLCAVHGREGPRARVGLGIYAGRRFHIDTRGYRGWGADHRGASFPCAAT